MKSRLLIVIAFLAAVVGADTVLAQSPQAEGEWNIVPSPNTGPQAGGNTLLAVDALSATDVWAVGFHYNNPNYCTFCPAPLAIHWDGTQWSLVNTPTIDVAKVELTSVEAVSSDDVWAVGFSYNPNCGLCSDTLIEHWDGKAWSVVASPNPGMDNRLYGLSATSANDIWAVGDQWPNWSTKHPLILHFDGTNWTEVASPQINQGRLDAVHALAPNDAWAVGPGLTLHWDGTSWTQAPLPPEEGYVILTSVSGVASNDVWAVGNFQYSSQSGQNLSSSRAFHWDGSTWTRVLYAGLGGQDSRTYDVHAIASDDVWAVGGQPGAPGSGVAFEYVTAHWDGASWSTVDTPNQGILYSVSASSSTDVWAVGAGFNNTGTHTLRFTVCPADTDHSGAVGIDDLLAVIEAWGVCANPNNCPADVNHSGVVDIDDLLAVIGNWGPC